MTQEQMDEAIAEDRLLTLGFRGGNRDGWKRVNKRHHFMVVKMREGWGAVLLPADYDRHQQEHADGWNNVVRFADPVTAAVYLLTLG